ncbi:hypothetical protein TWF506_004140 [Arthrobotrys conoides]|uniref:Uncharacterized protein n=1 Tax=Arthrobotrys conoides TaxID=74498 RepID=A0AAN8RTT5_9PEZI
MHPQSLRRLHLIISILLAILTITNASPAYNGITKLPRIASPTSSLSSISDTKVSTDSTPDFMKWLPPSPRNISTQQNVHDDEEVIPYEILPVIHPDMLCVPIAIPEIDASSGDCKIDSFCSPFDPKPVHVNKNNTTTTTTSTPQTHHLKGRYSPHHHQRQEPPGTFYAITLPGSTIPIYFPTATLPPSHKPHKAYPPGAHPLFEYSTITVPPDPTSPIFIPIESHTQVPTHPSSQLNPLQKPCRIPKIYEGICHPLVIPSIVLTAYFLSTYILYSGDPSRPVFPVYQPPPPPPPPLNPNLPHFYHNLHNYRRQQASTAGSYLYPPVATIGYGIRKNLLCLVNFFCGGPEEDVPVHPNQYRPSMLNINPQDRVNRLEEIKRANQTSCYFLTTLLTYGAGLIILGSFLGGLCSCVRSECEFS